MAFGDRKMAFGDMKMALGFISRSGARTAFGDRKMALNRGAHRARRYLLFKVMLEILRCYPEARRIKFMHETQM